MIKQAQNNWLQLSVDDVIENVMEYLRTLTATNV